jgi:hypothetical protein
LNYGRKTNDFGLVVVVVLEKVEKVEKVEKERDTVDPRLGIDGVI